jgi:glycosyltransferase involved in cell wall biosynthesis
MKVLLLLDQINRGGAETLTLDVCKNAKKNGLDLIFVSLSKGDLETEFDNSGVTYFKLNRRYPIDFSVIFKLRKIIIEQKIEIIHTNQAVEGIHAYLASFGTDVKNVMHFHGYKPNKKDDLVRSFLIPRMAKNIAVSNAFLKRLSTQSKFNTMQNFTVIYNGVDIRKFYTTKGNLRDELKIAESSIMMGMIGNFYNDGRDQLTICKSLPGLFHGYPDLHFIFIGGRSDVNPQYFDECFSYCKNKNILDKTHFIGHRSDINNILNSLNVFVYSSNHDSFGISVIEAMSLGLPVVINDLDSLLEITDNGKFVYVFKTKDEKNLTDIISNLLDCEEERERISKSGREWVLKNFTIDHYIENLKHLYNSLIF